MAGVVLKQFEVSEFASVIVNDDVPIVVSKSCKHSKYIQ